VIQLVVSGRYSNIAGYGISVPLKKKDGISGRAMWMYGK
jgi:hypothetical protein